MRRPLPGVWRLSRAQRALPILIAVALALALSLSPRPSDAALAITPPQLVPDEAGIVVTDVQSSLPVGSRWSVRLVQWTPGESDPRPAAGDVSPRFFSLEANGRQVVRARIRNASGYHRLLIEQVADDSRSGQGLAFRFRFSLPVYRQASEPQEFVPQVPVSAGCHPFQNSRPLAVRLVLSPDVKGPQTLLPGETAELCRSTQTASQ